MPPCVDVYVWVPRCDPDALTTFIDRYVDPTDPGDSRLAAFLRTYVHGTADPDDRAALDDLRRSPTDAGLSLYLRARDHYGAIVTVTAERALVLGLSLDEPAVTDRAQSLLDHLRAEFDAPAGCAGVELPPAHSKHDWETEPTTVLRSGEVPSC